MIAQSIELGIGEHTLFSVFSGRAWDECKELQLAPKLEWENRLISTIIGYPRIEVTVYDEDGWLGGCVLVHETDDPHVGECLSVLCQYVFPEYRNRGVSRLLLRAARLIARREGLNVLAYSHRVKDYVYQTTYKRNP